MYILFKFIFGALIYLGIEVVWDGTTDRKMGLVGGLAFIICGKYDEWFNLPILALWMLIGTTVVVIELIAGLLWNKDYKIWDYRKMPFNYKGHICMFFYLLWIFPIAPLILWADKII
ncbi:putative ABC transporter permease [Fusibacter ferrireducens]|uniref:Uncharacterized protein n=1 Tax=Fusibacter ferrireducens TaxID=2785058 RepID=A0ABR9ZT45_9FIRM|nr:hypothetical protein [Fusibacter ferrireducens]MBF4693627.1 hypothetical protein [Fusibacter ferrireducens]